MVFYGPFYIAAIGENNHLHHKEQGGLFRAPIFFHQIKFLGLKSKIKSVLCASIAAKEGKKPVKIRQFISKNYYYIAFSVAQFCG